MRKSKIMKALLVFGMSAVTATSIVGFAACDSGNGGGEGGGEGGSNGHVHSWSDWTDDGNGSTHSRTCSADGHEGNAKETQDHVDADNNGVCDVCSYVFHVHDWATDYTNTDVNKHYIECLASGHPAGEYKNEGSHVDEDLDGNCDVCGYGYNIPEKFTELLDKVGEGTTKVLADTFVNSRKLAEFSSAGSVGITSSVSETCYTEVKDGVANLVDTDSTNSATMYADFGAAYGIIEGYFEVTPIGSTPNVTPIQFYGENGTNEVFGLRMQGNALNWRVGGSGNGTALSPAITLSAGTAIKVYFSFNCTTNLITVHVNGTKVLEDQAVSSNLRGIKFVSQASGTATISVDNLIIINTAVSLEEYKTALSAKANAAKALIANGITVNDTEAKSTFDSALAAADSSSACDTAYDTYYAALLTGYKSGANDKIANDYPSTSYTTVGSNKEDYEAAVGALSTALDSANTIEKVTAAYNTANTALNAIHNDAYYAKQDVVITISNGKTGNNTLTVKEGDVVEKADLDALVDIPNGQAVSGYTDSNGEVTFPYTVNANVELTAVLVTLTLTDVDYLCSNMAAETWSAEKVLVEGVLSITASSSNTVVVDASAKTVGDAKSTHRIKLGGAGSADYRSIKMNLQSAATIKVYALSSSSSADRTVSLYDSTYTKTDPAQSLTCGGSGDVKELVYTVNGAGVYYIGCEASGLNVYRIVIEYTK